jgi:hypothetical protein
MKHSLIVEEYLACFLEIKHVSRVVWVLGELKGHRVHRNLLSAHKRHAGRCCGGWWESAGAVGRMAEEIQRWWLI